MARPISIPGISHNPTFPFVWRSSVVTHSLSSCIVSCAMYVMSLKILANVPDNKLAKNEASICKYVPQGVRVGNWITPLLGLYMHV